MTLLISDALAVAFDAIHPNVADIPADAFAVGGYVDGAITRFIWTPDDWARFPNSYHIRINVTGVRNRGNTLDVENGDAVPANVQPWIENKGGCPDDPLLVYCNRSNLNACVAARDAARDATGIYAWIWEATLDGTISSRGMTQSLQTRLPDGTAVTDVSFITDPKLRGLMAARIGQQ
jgi:hypothetical protein